MSDVLVILGSTDAVLQLLTEKSRILPMGASENHQNISRATRNLLNLKTVKYCYKKVTLARYFLLHILQYEKLPNAENEPHHATGRSGECVGVVFWPVWGPCG